MHTLVGHSAKMEELKSLIEMAAATEVSVVIQGESGTGKELAAAAIHHLSTRKKNPFIRVNCAALAETLLESELFGHVKGAFTGAFRDRMGRFEAAEGGTLFLDEVSEISPAMQAKLLRVLQERMIARVGDNQERPVDVRVIAATNRHLRTMISRGKFREDLFYRLNVFPIHIPPLRERKTDIPLLCSTFLEKHGKRMGKSIHSLSPDVMRIFMGYCWPGNVRELENSIEHAFVLCRTDEIQVADLPHELRVAVVRDGICAEKEAEVAPRFHPAPMGQRKTGGRISLNKTELEDLLKKNNGNRAATARELGVSTVGLWKKMKKLGMYPS